MNNKKTLGFRWIAGDVDWLKFGGTFISRKIDKFPSYYLVREICPNPQYIEGCDEDKYFVFLYKVSPLCAKPEDIKAALEFQETDLDELPQTEKDIAVYLVQYGAAEQLYCKSGNNYKHLFADAQAYAQGVVYSP